MEERVEVLIDDFQTDLKTFFNELEEFVRELERDKKFKKELSKLSEPEQKEIKRLLEELKRAIDRQDLEETIILLSNLYDKLVSTKSPYLHTIASKISDKIHKAKEVLKKKERVKTATAGVVLYLVKKESKNLEQITKEINRYFERLLKKIRSEKKDLVQDKVVFNLLAEAEKEALKIYEQAIRLMRTRKEKPKIRLAPKPSPKPPSL